MREAGEVEEAEPLTRRARGPFDLITRLHRLQARLARLYGRPSRGMQTPLRHAGKPVIFLHNPKTGGKSLRTLLGAGGLSHAFPSERLNAGHWLECYAVVAVRDPFDRFLSGYFDHVRRPKPNALMRMYGPEFKQIGPGEYLRILVENPKFGGAQSNWTDFPHPAKPRADLVLRYEEIAQWEAQIAAAGLDVQGRSLPHRNRGARAGQDPATLLGMTPAAFLDLERAVRTAFHADALAFGYPTAAPISKP